MSDRVGECFSFLSPSNDGRTGLRGIDEPRSYGRQARRWNRLKLVPRLSIFDTITLLLCLHYVSTWILAETWFIRATLSIAVRSSLPETSAYETQVKADDGCGGTKVRQLSGAR